MSLTPRLDKLDRNYIINGGMDYWQRGTSVSNNLTTDTAAQAYVADRFKNSVTRSGSNIGLVTARQSDVPSTEVLSYSLRTTSSYSTSFGSTSANGVPIHQRIEGTFISDLKPSQDIYISFYIKCNFTGNVPVGLVKLNSSGNLDEQGYMWNESVVANTWKRVYKKITLPPQSIYYGTNTSMYIVIGTCSGTGWSYYNASAIENTWNMGSTPPLINSSSTNWMSTAGNWIQVTAMRISKYEHDEFTLAASNLIQELALCQRYFEKSYKSADPVASLTQEGAIIFVGGISGNDNAHIYWKVTKRSAPVVTLYDESGTSSSAKEVDTGTARTFNPRLPSEFGTFLIQSAGVNLAGVRLRIHFISDAEL